MTFTPASPPGPKILDLLKIAPAIRSDPLSFLVSLHRQYGDAVQLPLGPKPAFFFNRPNAVRYILQENARAYDKTTLQWHALEQITGSGLLAANGDAWLTHRRLASPAFHRSQSDRLLDGISKALDVLVTRWNTYAETGETVFLDQEMLHLSLDVVGSSLFSTDLTTQAGEIVSSVITALDTIVYRVSTPYALPAFIPTSRNRAFTKSIQRLDQVVYPLISARKNAFDPGDDFLGLFIRAQKEGRIPLSDRDIRNEMLTAIIAGHETVAMAMSWAFYLIAKHSDVEQRLLASLRQPASIRHQLVDDISGVAYEALVKAVFLESLRLYPPAWLITRRALQPDVVDGFTVPAGSMIILSPYTLHRHPEFWPDPDCFNPGRFLKESDKTSRAAYLPFGAGPRMCIGSNFAEVEAQAVISNLLPTYRLEFICPQPELEALVTLRPRGGLPVRIMKR